MQTRQTIVIVAHDVGGRGGMERHLEELITRLKRDAHVIVVACTVTLADMEGVRFVRIPVISRPAPLKIILFAILASIYLLFIKRDVLHTTGAIVFNRAQLSTVHFCHSGYMADTGGSRAHHSHSWVRRINSQVATRIAVIMEKVIYKPARTPLLVAVSNRVKDEVLACFPYENAAVYTVPNGVDIKRFHPHSEDEKRALRGAKGLPQDGIFLLFMGGDWGRKGLEHLLKAFQVIAELLPAVHLCIVGIGDVSGYMKFVAPHLRSYVHFVGPQSDPESWFGLSNAFILPSSYETFSLVVHEAGASALIVLSTNVGGVEDLIDDGTDGFIIQCDVGSIIRCLEPIVSNIDLYEGTGQRLREKVLHLTWDDMYGRMAALYGFIQIQAQGSEGGLRCD